MFDSRIQNDFVVLLDQWDRAERIIKEVELQRQECVGSSIVELRYAGRRLADALHFLAENANSLDDEEKITHTKNHIFEATQNCIRAQHDAVDAYIYYLGGYFRIMENQFGVSAICTYFPQYLDVKKRVDKIHEIIARSREERKIRNDLYEEIENDHIPEVTALYDSMEQSRELLNADITRARRRKIAERVISWGLALASLIIAILASL